MTAWAWKVYKAVMGIPFGQVRTYKWVAARAGKPGACRAVGQVLKSNPYLLVIPCHRVIKSDNSWEAMPWAANARECFWIQKRRY